MTCLTSKTSGSKIYKKRTIFIESSKRGTPRVQKIAFNISNFHHFNYNIADAKGTVLANDYINVLSIMHLSYQFPN